MPELETIAICSVKNPSERAVINLMDFDPAIHTKWGEEKPMSRSTLRTARAKDVGTEGSDS